MSTEKFPSRTLYQPIAEDDGTAEMKGDFIFTKMLSGYPAKYKIIDRLGKADFNIQYFGDGKPEGPIHDFHSERLGKERPLDTLGTKEEAA